MKKFLIQIKDLKKKPISKYKVLNNKNIRYVLKNTAIRKFDN